MKLMLVSAVLVGGLGVARADDAKDLGYQVAQYVANTESAKGAISRIDASKPPAGCTDVVAKARKAGLKTLRGDFKSIGGTYVESEMAYDITLDQAAAACKAYGQYYALGRYAQEWENIQRDLGLLNPDDDPSPEFVKKDLELAAQCTKHANEIAAAGVPASLPWKLDSNRSYTAGDLKPKFCDALVKAAGQFTKEKIEAEKKALEKYAKAGISGDKLDLMRKYGGGVFLPGGKGSDDLKQYARASALFVWTTGPEDDEGYVVHTVRKYTFQGNAQTGSSEQTYRKRKGEKVGAVFN